ncbi:competence protein CoiA family protein [Actinoallomurus soli]|uniref:competence protein CoiA family protein n=1 Tax=Actinoallomurus soli TaxID=2952535 RepID=UPI002093055C|nr:competence protein CoiA family protein [Actinoallomurus soli]MCO5967496.1 hypothetical protein [Actinoallomurus soli]
MHDTRKVQTAVYGGPNSLDPIFMPFDRADAKLLREGYDPDSFYCGQWIGGCGRRLYTRIGSIRVPHFAHTPDNDDTIVRCRRTNTDEASADHLYIRREITQWIERQGRFVKDVSINGKLPGEGGVCTGLTFSVDKEFAFEVSLRDDFSRQSMSEWKTRNRALQKVADKVNWVFADKLPVDHVFKEQGFVLRVRCDSVGTERSVRVGVQRRGHVVHWSDLSECTLTEHGIWTPYIDDARRYGQSRLNKATQPAPKQIKPDKSKQEEPAAEPKDYPGFPIAVDNLIIAPLAQSTIPTRITHQKRQLHSVMATVKGGISGYRELSIQVFLPRQVSDLRAGHRYRLTSPSTVDALVGSKGKIAWKFYTQALEPIDEAPEQSAVKPPLGVAIKSPSEALVDHPAHADITPDTPSSPTTVEPRSVTHSEEREQVTPEREDVDLEEAREAPALSDEEMIEEIEEWINLAIAASMEDNPKDAHQFHAAALELFPKVPITQVDAIKRQIDHSRNLISLAEVRTKRSSNPVEIINHLRRAMKLEDEESVSALRVDLIAALDKRPGKPRVWAYDKWVWRADRWLAVRRLRNRRVIKKSSPKEAEESAKTKAAPPEVSNPAPEAQETPSKEERQPGEDELAARIREALETTARNQSTTTWRQLTKAIKHELPTDSQGRIELLAKVEEQTNPGDPLLSALIIAGDRYMHRLYPELCVALSRPFPEAKDERDAQWALEVLHVHQRWRHL